MNHVEARPSSAARNDAKQERILYPPYIYISKPRRAISSKKRILVVSITGVPLRQSEFNATRSRRKGQTDVNDELKKGISQFGCLTAVPGKNRYRSRLCSHHHGSKQSDTRGELSPVWGQRQTSTSTRNIPITV